MNAFSIKVRSLARRAGLIGLYHRLRPARPYEDQFHKALRAAVLTGDIVWDVGANVGVYTEQFCEWVGPEGFVVAFEPTPQSLAAIRERVPPSPHLLLEPVALGDTAGQVSFVVDGSSVTNHIERASSAAASAIPVEMATGDQVCQRLGHIPNVIKIDVEGFEEEVLRGLTQTLAAKQLRTVLVEVHFLQLEQRGQPNAPIRIEKLLREKNFVTTWTDPSHLKAERA